MAISTIVVRGYGTWSGVNYLPTLGYKPALEVPPGPYGAELALNARRTQFALNSRRTQYEVKET